MCERLRSLPAITARLAACVLPLLLHGCREDVKLMAVTGTVKLDGAPLPDALVEFLPIVEGNEPARPASGMTNAQGRYELQYTTSRGGARMGKYRVKITTRRPALPGAGGEMIPAVLEKVPDVYNSRTDLVVEVTKDQLNFDFDLSSSAGVVRQPRDSD